jgi:hypothetical protein
MAHEICCALQFFFEPRARRELQPISRGGERPDARSRGVSGRGHHGPRRPVARRPVTRRRLQSHRSDKRLNARRDVRSGKELREQMLQLALGLPRGRAQDLLAPLCGQVIAQHQGPGQVNLTAFDHAQRHRKAANQPRRGDAAARFVLAHSQAAQAEVEQRAARGLQIQPALFDFTQVREQPREDSPSLADQTAHAGEQLFVGQVRKVHRRLLPLTISLSGLAIPPAESDIGLRLAGLRHRNARRRSVEGRVGRVEGPPQETGARAAQNTSREIDSPGAAHRGERGQRLQHIPQISQNGRSASSRTKQRKHRIAVSARRRRSASCKPRRTETPHRRQRPMTAQRIPANAGNGNTTSPSAPMTAMRILASPGQRSYRTAMSAHDGLLSPSADDTFDWGDATLAKNPAIVVSRRGRQMHVVERASLQTKPGDDGELHTAPADAIVSSLPPSAPASPRGSQRRADFAIPHRRCPRAPAPSFASPPRGSPKTSSGHATRGLSFQ